jgi:glycosyltransferase involved in cell wall biosynthesis
MSLRKPKVVIAGQLPPPFGGQNIMIGRAVAQFAQTKRCESAHLAFFFTPDVKTARKGGAGKLLEVLRVIGRLVRIRLAGPIDLLLFPTGGPQTVPLIRDVLLLPWFLLLSKRAVLHFHAAGIADRLAKNPTSLLNRAIAFLYGKAFAAVVMTNFNRRDPARVGIQRVLVLPCQIADKFDARLLNRDGDKRTRLLYVGHLCPDKGTPDLLRAFARISRKHPDLELDLMGECLPPFTDAALEELIEELQIGRSVQRLGVLTGEKKAEAFGRANLLIFPTIAPYESFGLVLAEAMSWRLPIVASDWRGNRDVLTADAGAICFPVSSSLADDIVAALAQALEQRDQWTEWGQRNRTIFEQRYDENRARDWLVEPLLSLIGAPLDEPVSETAHRTSE